MGVPAHDARDSVLAELQRLPVVNVIGKRGDGGGDADADATTIESNLVHGRVRCMLDRAGEEAGHLKFAVFLFRRKEGGILIADFMLVSCGVFLSLLLLLPPPPPLAPTLQQVKGSEPAFVSFISSLVAEVGV